MYDDVYHDTVYDVAEAQAAVQRSNDEVVEKGCVRVGHDFRMRRSKNCRLLKSHLASGVWNLSREQGNKLTLNVGNRRKIDLNCPFCACNETWNLHSAFCLRRVFRGFHDYGDPIVRA
ncbi:phytochrome A-associated F-box protein-like [Tripterygium wilfordii]|uniref:phytochrome A-associated F-box protein-like n=1 Tax=Tripterygium wilfordii TaxID=458696 RepID=UPI0018F840CF|nr:phytochrome A-associated F-box protein-like [Tripterygium wilfordii]